MTNSTTDKTVLAYPEGECTILAEFRDLVAASPRQAPTGYEVGNLLGRGGEGEVHEANQLAFGRTVAIKTLRPGHDDERHVQRFQAEAAITAMLEHPNIVPVHDLCRDPQGFPQLVMKRVSGRTWRAIIEAGSATVDEQVEILLKVCDAVEFAHGLGMLHRDLKPENIMVGNHGEVLVMDWGCAAHVGPQRPHPFVPLLCELSGASGTPSYMSPEQARADHAACGTWSDVHLLGASLYHVLTGSAPRRGADVRGILASAMCGDPIDDPSVRAGKRVSLELGSVALAALHPDPAKRTTTVQGFAQALRRYVEHREVHTLVANARQEHEQARAGGAGSRAADDGYRRALSTIEQAVRLWPELVSARRLEVSIGLDAARHAAATGALQQALRLAQATHGAADRLGDGKLSQQASELAEQATVQQSHLQRREQTQRRMRVIAMVAGLCAVMSLVIGIVLVWRESARTAVALNTAEANLLRANSEHAARQAGERLAAPALLAQARELAQQRQFAEGLPLADAAIGFAPSDPQPLLLKAQLLIALARRAEAVIVLDAALAIRPDANVSELRRLCAESPINADARMAEVLVRMGARAVASTLHVSADQRTALAISHLRQAWPSLPATSVRTGRDDMLTVILTAGDVLINSLEPLRGLPISSLDITGQKQVRDLGPLVGLPLTFLAARFTGVRDFSPLQKLPLRRLYLGWYESGFDVTKVRGLQLEALDAPCFSTVDLAALAGMPLKELRLWGCDQLRDISALKNMPLEQLTLAAPDAGTRTLSDLSPLAGLMLTELNLSWQQGVTSLEPLRGQQPKRLVLHGTSVKDLSPVMSPLLRHLAAGFAPITDVRPLLTTQIESLDFSPQYVTQGLDELISLPSMRAICGYKPDDFRRWRQLCGELSEHNPGFTWFLSAVFTDGHLREARVFMPLISLAPLANYADLRVLHLTGTIGDLQPLAKLPLVELVCAPTRDAVGLAAIRTMASLLRIGTTAKTLRPAAEFWRDFDARIR